MERTLLFFAAGFFFVLLLALVRHALSLRRRAKANATFFDKLVAATYVDATPHGTPAVGTTKRAPAGRPLVDDLSGESRRRAEAASAARRDDEDAARRRRESDEAATRVQQDIALQSALLAVQQHAASARAQVAQDPPARGVDAPERGVDTPSRSDDTPSVGSGSSWSSSPDTSSTASSSFSSSSFSSSSSGE